MHSFDKQFLSYYVAGITLGEGAVVMNKTDVVSALTELGL